MKTTIICENPNHGTLNFYLNYCGQRYYLFSQRYYASAYSHFKNGVVMRDACNKSKSHRDYAILKIMDKIPKYITYIEKEYGIKVS